MDAYKAVTNPGSAIGEAIGASMERALEAMLSDIADEYGCHYLTAGVRKTKNGQTVKKLLMSDNYGNEYDIDGVITNASMQPLILFESKYIRYKKHNRDKGSWICTAHSAVRRRYHSVRSSIAVLAGSWSISSQAMMRSNDINLFLIPFDTICEALSPFGIDFMWAEKDREKATAAWHQFNVLTTEQKDSVGTKMTDAIRESLASLIKNILDDSVSRAIEKVLVELVSNLGEVKSYEFRSAQEALEFLGQESLDTQFLTTNSVTLFDPPPQLD